MAPKRDPDFEALIDKAHGFTQMYERWLTRRLGGGDGVTLPRLKVLFILHDLGPQKMSVLARDAKVAPRTLTTLVDALEREGLARRIPHSVDRRATIIEMTPAGMKAVESKSGPYWAAKNFLFVGLTAEERNTMSRIYDRWSRMVEEDLTRMGEEV
jgi:DNA-binding MarR family transcriptional regulator